MNIKKIEISNFKSFDRLSVNLDNFNILIGANASGKSNFIQLFRFLRDLSNDGLDNAISLQGGIEYLRNTKIGKDKDLSISLIIHKIPAIRVIEEKPGLTKGISFTEANYSFKLKFHKKGRGFDVSEDRMVIKCEFINLIEKGKGEIEENKIGTGKFIVSNINGKIDFKTHLSPKLTIDEKKDFQEALLPPFFIRRKYTIPNRTLLLETRFCDFLFPSFIGKPFGDFSIFDFYPKSSKTASLITGKKDLEEDGNNLSIVIKNIISNKENKRKLTNLLKDLLPFVDALKTKKLTEKSLLFNLRETYNLDLELPASLISDGTINIIALIVAIYFDKESTSEDIQLIYERPLYHGQPIKIFEEPERNIHPGLISKVMQILKEASAQKQIIVTTHNPEVVKHADLKDILFIYRKTDGFSTIKRPSEDKEVKNFLKNEIGIEELFIQNLL